MLKDSWYRLLSKLLVFLYYHRVRVSNAEQLSGSGPMLFVALHRNGAVDGYVYKSLLPRVNFLISVQLRRSWAGRLFFGGIEVARSKDRAAGSEATDNSAAIDACADYVRQGGALLILPEGTSDLGHHHRLFHKGAARILAQLTQYPDSPVTVIPLGIHYERAWAWQSDVEVVAGAPISTVLPPGISSSESIHLLHERIVSALEALAVQAEDAETFSMRERIAYAATLGSKRSYFATLKAIEGGLPEAEALALKLEDEMLGSDRGRGLWLHQGVPLVPMNHAWAYPPLFIFLLPLATLAALFNAPVLLCAWWAGRRFSDAPNTIALWRLLVGFPCLVIWAALLLVAALLAQALPLWLTYVAVSAAGVKTVRRVQKLAISLHNWVIAPSLRKPLLNWRESLEACMRSRNV